MTFAYIVAYDFWPCLSTHHLPLMYLSPCQFYSRFVWVHVNWPSTTSWWAAGISPPLMMLIWKPAWSTLGQTYGLWGQLQTKQPILMLNGKVYKATETMYQDQEATNNADQEATGPPMPSRPYIHHVRKPHLFDLANEPYTGLKVQKLKSKLNKNTMQTSIAQFLVKP